MNKFSSAAVSIPDMDGKEIDGGKGECVGMAINKGSIGRSVTAIPTRRNSFFRRISVIQGSFRSASMIDSVDMSLGSLRHSSMQGMPSLVAMTPDIEQKLVRTRTSDLSPDSTGITNKIPTEVSEITWDWVRVVLNQYRLTFCDKPAVSRESIIDVSIFDCKKSVGDFSSTYQIDVIVEDEDAGLYGSSSFDHPRNKEREICAKTNKKCYSFIAKLLPADDPARACVFEANLLEKEIELYFELLPSLRQFIRLTEMKRRKQMEIENEPQDKSPGVSSSTGSSIHSRKTFIDSLTPQCVYSSHNTDGAGVIVFKNSCSDASFENCSDPNGMSLAQVLTVVRAMAKFHAAGRAFLARNRTQAVKRRYPYLEEDMYSNSSFVQEVNGHLTTYDEFLKTAAQELEKTSPSSGTFSPKQESQQHSNHIHYNLSHTSLIEARKQFGRLLNVDTWQLVRGLCRPGPSSLTTICHGELWERNILIKSTSRKEQITSLEDQCSDNLNILDWKNAKIATATLDLAFLMLTSTKSAMRAESTADILSTYHEVFCQYLSTLNPSLEKPTIEELEIDYNHSLEYAITQAICMFVQQMHFYNTVIEDLPSENYASYSSVEGRDSASSDEKENTKNYQDALDKLRSYECRALNLFRDIDITQLQAFDEKNSPSNRDLNDSEDCFRARKSTLCGGLAGLQDPDNMTI